MNRRRNSFVAATVLVAVALFGGVASAQEEEPAVVTVFHAVPAEDGFPADVYLDGELIIDGFVFESSSDSFELASGSATLEIYADGSDPQTDSPAVSTPVTFEAGVNYSVVAQIADGSPVISIYANDLSGVGPGESRITFRQTSSVAALDVAVGDGISLGALNQTEEASTVVQAGVVPLTLSDDSGESIFSDDLDIANGVLTVVYAVGDPGEGNFDLLVQEVPISQVSPTGVPTGDGGMKSTGSVVPWAALVLVLAVAAGWIGRRRTT